MAPAMQALFYVLFSNSGKMNTKEARRKLLALLLHDICYFFARLLIGRVRKPCASSINTIKTNVSPPVCILGTNLIFVVRYHILKIQGRFAMNCKQ
jgi:hypothetical protein